MFSPTKPSQEVSLLANRLDRSGLVSCRLLHLQLIPPDQFHAVYPSSSNSRRTVVTTAVLQSAPSPGSKPVCRQATSPVQASMLRPIMFISSSSSRAVILRALVPVLLSRQGLSMHRHMCRTARGQGNRHTLSVLVPAAFAARPRLTLMPSAAASRLQACRLQAQICSSGPSSIQLAGGQQKALGSRAALTVLKGKLAAHERR